MWNKKSVARKIDEVYCNGLLRVVALIDDDVIDLA